MNDVPFVLININCKKIHFQLKIPQGLESTNFVADIYQAIERNKDEGKNDFMWLQKYTCARNGDSNELLFGKFENDVSYWH